VLLRSNTEQQEVETVIFEQQVAGKDRGGVVLEVVIVRSQITPSTTTHYYIGSGFDLLLKPQLTRSNLITGVSQ